MTLSAAVKAAADRARAEHPSIEVDAVAFEKHLARAESMSLDPSLTAVIKRNQDFLRTLQSKAQRSRRH